MDLTDAPVPPALADAVARSGDPLREAWLAELPGRVAALAERWGLRVGAPFLPGGSAAWVAPARDAAGSDVVLKVGWTHAEARDEAEGLAVWAGHGAVHVHERAEEGTTSAMVLERCRPGEELRTRPVEEQHRVVGGLLRRLHAVQLPADHGFRTLTQLCDGWADQAVQGHARAPEVLDAGLVRDGLELWRELPRTAAGEVLLVTDLHAGNVLSAQREPWLLVDPKPYAGDPCYDAVQHLLNCDQQLHADAPELVRAVSAAAGLDEQRVLRWLFARCVQESWNWPVLAPAARRLASAALA